MKTTAEIQHWRSLSLKTRQQTGLADHQLKVRAAYIHPLYMSGVVEGISEQLIFPKHIYRINSATDRSTLQKPLLKMLGCNLIVLCLHLIIKFVSKFNLELNKLFRSWQVKRFCVCFVFRFFSWGGGGVVCLSVFVLFLYLFVCLPVYHFF